MKKLTYADRISLCGNIIAKKLLTLMTNKASNLCFSADVSQPQQLLSLADQIGPEICVLKTHVDILDSFSSSFITDLKNLANKHRFLIFEDRKFSDIGNTVKIQYEGGIYHIIDWADMVNAHSLPGDGIIKALREAGQPKQRGLLLLAEMSSAGNLLDAQYTQKTLAMAKKYPDFVFGFISQHKLCDDPHWIYLTPGVQIKAKGDALGQQYVTPEKAIIENQTDIIIVGRGILEAANPVAAAKEYREIGWRAYLKR
jgi:uridine monophosphate synthetase